MNKKKQIPLMRIIIKAIKVKQKYKNRLFKK